MSESADFYSSWLGCNSFGVAPSKLLAAVIPVPFAPTDLSDCLLWYDANDGATITTDPMDGKTILTWDSLGTASGFTLLPNVGSAQSESDTINGLNVATFTSGNNMITNAVSLNTQESTWFFVVESLTDLSGEAIPFLVLYNGNDLAAYSVGAFYSAGDYGLGIGPSGVSSTLAYNSAVNPYPNPLIYALRLNSDGTQNFLQVNGTSLTLTSSYPATGFNTLPVTWTVGRSDGTSMNVGEIICYGRALSDAEVVQVNAYLSDKWAITISP